MISCRFQGADCKSSRSSIDGGQKLATGKITGDLGHKRERVAGELKEEVESVPFCRLPVVVNRSDGNRSRKVRWWSARSWNQKGRRSIHGRLRSCLPGGSSSRASVLRFFPCSPGKAMLRSSLGRVQGRRRGAGARESRVGEGAVEMRDGLFRRRTGVFRRAKASWSMRDGLFLLPTKTGGGCPDIAAAGGGNRNLTFYRSQHQHEQLEWLRLRPLDAGAVT